MEYTDKTLICQECQAEFTFTAAEQQYHAEQGYASEPKRCPECRRKRKAASGGGGREASRNRPDGPRGAPRGNRATYSATCSACGQQTQVPFQPAEGRPVYCRSCWESRRGQSS